MKSIKLTNIGAGRILPPVLLFINLVLLTLFIFVGARYSFHSDTAAFVLLAREISETGKYLPSDWYFANGDLWILCHQTLIASLLRFFPAGYKVLAISNIIYTSIILGIIWLLSGLTQASNTRRLLIIAVIAAGISPILLDMVFTQMVYGYTLVFCCLAAFLGWKTLETDGRIKSYFGIALALVLVISLWTNPQRAVIFFVFPLLFATSFSLFSNVDRDFSRHHVKSAIILFSYVLSGIVIGYCFRLMTRTETHIIAGVTDLRFASYDVMLANLAETPKLLLSILDGLPTTGIPVKTRTGLYQMLRFCAALALFILIPISIYKAYVGKKNSLVFLATFALALFALVLFVQVISVGLLTDRYFIPPLLLMLVIALAQNYDFSKTPFLIAMQTMVIVMLSTSSVHQYVKTKSLTRASISPLAVRTKDFLIANGLQYGYASFWNAGVTSVMSNEKVLVRQIHVATGIPTPCRWLGSARWYKPSAFEGKTFLLLTKEESELIDWNKMASYGLKPNRELAFEDYKIYTFSENISKHLPGWDHLNENKTSLASGD